MLRTLQLYIFRELGKTFVLTGLGLTAVLSMGGGVLNMIRLDEVTVGALLKLMTLVVPVAATLTLPVAAMYSAAATYGRMAADNELVACRSGGINILLLLWPVVLLSMVSAVAMFVCLNFVIPGLVRNIDQIVGADIESIIRQRLTSPGRALPGLDRFRIYADAFDVRSDGPNSRVLLTGVAFLEMTEDEVLRVGTAARVEFLIDRTQNQPRLSGLMSELSYYERKTNRFVDEPEQRLGPVIVPLTLPPRLKFLDLPALLQYRAAPTAWSEIREQMDDYRVAVGRAMAYRHFIRMLETIHRIELPLSAGGSYTLSAAPRDGAIALQVHPDGSIGFSEVTVIERQEKRERITMANSATLEVLPASTLKDCLVQVDLYDNVRAPDFGQSPQSVSSRDTLRLRPAALPASVLAEVDHLTDQDLLSPQLPVAGDPRIARHREQLIGRIGATVRKITGILHQRLSFTVSVFVLGLLAAGLGILFNQSQLLVSVGISMVPGALVVVTIMMGKQLAENPTTAGIGLLVIWGGIVAVALLDAWLLCRKIRR